MAVLNFSAHVLLYAVQNGGTYDNETGDWVEGCTEWKKLCECDIVPAGRANMIALPDGEQTGYSYTISNLPKDCIKLKYGDKVRILFYGNLDDVQEFKVLGFHRYQHQCKIWV